MFQNLVQPIQLWDILPKIIRGLLKSSGYIGKQWMLELERDDVKLFQIYLIIYDIYDYAFLSECQVACFSETDMHAEDPWTGNQLWPDFINLKNNILYIMSLLIIAFQLCEIAYWLC